VEILLLTATQTPAAVLPALSLLPHSVRTAGRDLRAFTAGESPGLVLVDARSDLVDARATCLRLHAIDPSMPLLAVMLESGLPALTAAWGIDDVILAVAGPAEVEARLRLAHGRHHPADPADGHLIRAGELTIDPDTYTAKLKGRPLNLTYKEFELLKFLTQQPGRVFSRSQLLHDVWGYDYFGGTRTVDVHVRRLRAKLGSEYESMIGTVRQVGYKLVLPPPRTSPHPTPILTAVPA